MSQFSKKWLILQVLQYRKIRDWMSVPLWNSLGLNCNLLEPFKMHFLCPFFHQKYHVLQRKLEQGPLEIKHFYGSRIKRQKITRHKVPREPYKERAKKFIEIYLLHSAVCTVGRIASQIRNLTLVKDIKAMLVACESWAFQFLTAKNLVKFVQQTQNERNAKHLNQ